MSNCSIASRRFSPRAASASSLVYEAFDTVIERRVALKMLRTEVFPAEQLPEVRARLKREAHSAGKLSHRNIVTIFDYGEQRVNRPSGAGHALRRLDPFAD